MTVLAFTHNAGCELDLPNKSLSPTLAPPRAAAERDGQRLYAEAKGRTAAPGLDVDTLYGQLLRRMPAEEAGRAEFAVVVPTEARGAYTVDSNKL